MLQSNRFLLQSGELELSSHLFIPENHPLLPELFDENTKDNQEYHTNKRLNLPVHNVPRRVSSYFFDKSRSAYAFPREVVYTKNWPESIVNKTFWGEEASFTKDFELRDYQHDPVRETLTELEKYKGTILQAKTGTGKTVMSLKVARSLGRKTLILVHTEFLLEQWLERIEQFLGIKAGIIKQEKCELDAPIVVGLFQTIYSRDYAAETFDSFGLVIVDEVHHLACDTFVTVIGKVRSRFRLGLSATPRRADGKEWIFKSHMGDVAIKVSKQLEKARVFHIDSGLPLLDLTPYVRRGRLEMHRIIEVIINSLDRNLLIVKFISEALENKRKIIVFSERREHLKTLYELLQEARECNASFMFGGLKPAEREEAMKADVLFSTYQYCSEALDLPDLDCAVLATPKGDVEQTVGRILRQVEDKNTPIVIDITDEGIGPFISRRVKRFIQYKEQEWSLTCLQM